MALWGLACALLAQLACFPKCSGRTDYGVIRPGSKNALLDIQSWSPRDFTHDRHRTVDDRPYGYTVMLMMVQTLAGRHSCSKSRAGEGASAIYPPPR